MRTDSEAIFIPECVTIQATITVQKDISALEIIPAEGAARLGQLVPLKKGSHLEICGKGFNGRTVKARCDGRFFFIFLRDLETPATDQISIAASQ